MKRSRLTEASLESVLSAVRSYAEIAGHYDNIFELELRITQAWSTATKNDFSFEDHSMILGASRAREWVPRWAAWISQRVFMTRACCVGNYIYQVRDGAYYSPMVEQLRQYGLQVQDIPWSQVREFERKSPTKSKRRIDGLLINTSKDEIVVVKSAVIQRRKSAEPVSLFNQSSLPKAIPVVPSGDIISLIISEMILRLAMPRATIRCVMILVDSEPGSREFYAYETTGTYMRQVSGPVFDVSSLPLMSSTHQLITKSGDVEDMAKPPSFNVRESLMRLPVDRATRAMMILDVLWERQAASVGLLTMPIGRIVKEIERRFLIEYTSDHVRHDVEDCLVAGGYILRPPYEAKCYALSPIGVFQALVARQMLHLTPATRPIKDAEPFLLSPVRKQARLWARYNSGEQVVDSQ